MADRYVQEIEEILEGKAPGPPQPEERTTVHLSGTSRTRRLLGRARPSPIKILGAGAALLLPALAISPVGLGLGLFWAALVLFLVAYAALFLRPQPPLPRRWRRADPGQPLGPVEAWLTRIWYP